MSIDDTDRVELKDQADSPPAYPPSIRSGGNAGSADIEEETSTEVASDRLTTDREVPRRAVADAPADVEPLEETALFEGGELDALNGRWTEIQTSFVDDPRRAVHQADALVTDVIGKIGDSFGKQRAKLEGQWERGDPESTENLRQVFQRYRSFFSRLLGL